MKLLVCVLERHYETGSDTWDVSIEIPGSEPFSWKVENPLDIAAQEEVRWYLEDYARSDPHRLGRAKVATDHLQACGRYLASLFEDLVFGLLISMESDPGDCTIQFRILADATSAFSIYALPWELLESSESWARFPGNVEVIRVVYSSALLEQRDNADTFNILIVSSRPFLAYDVPYRLMSQPIWALANSGHCKRPTKVSFCRPGTWTRLLKTLKEHGPGSIDLIHFDVHGQVNAGMYVSPH